MAINPALLVAAAILQDYFSDNATDAAMSAGVITCYHDNSRTTLKNWYYQTGSPGAYTYTALPNPLTLSAAGTITDANGNDTIPFWYPYSELDNETPQPYYVTVDNSNGQRQFTRQNFPFVPPNPGGASGTNTLRNLIVNNVFWRNAGTVTLTNTAAAILAPSQHDGFIANMADIQFVKNANGATDIAAFTPFTNINRLTGDATPEFYLNMSCNNTGTSETSKYIQIPICLHVDNLSGYATASVTIWTQNVAGSPNNTLTLKLYEFLGTGTTSPAAATLVTIMPSTTWQKTVVNFSFPQATLPPGGPGDDGWFLQIGLPVGVSYNMNIAKPSVYLSTIVPSDDFDTYEFVSSTIDAPHTGDVKVSLSDYNPFGWVPLNNGTVGSATSNATARGNIDTWPLFSKIWNKFSAYSNGTSNVLAPMVNNSGTPVAYGASAIADWNANNSIALTQTMGKVILGTVPVPSMTNSYSLTITSFTNSAGNLQANLANNVPFFTGMPIYFTNSGGALPTGLALNTIYYVGIYDGSTAIYISTSFANALAGTYIAYTDAGSGTSSIVAAFNNTLEGEYAHTQLINEVGPISTSTADTTGARVHVGSGTGGPPTNTATAAGQLPFNVTQPGVFLNMYMKL